MDLLIEYVNSHEELYPGGINMMYSTPSIYFDFVKNNASEDWSIKTGDFFPYADDPDSYWTGYFTSRPSLKGSVRKANNILQACKQLHALTRDEGGNGSLQVLSLEEAMGILQHHDAVTGTEKQYVADDYGRILNEG
eukprot:1008069_1